MVPYSSGQFHPEVLTVTERRAVILRKAKVAHRMIKAILFDFGGVIAEEGFFEGLRAIGKENGLDPDEFFRTVDALIYETGYLIGKADEASFWKAVRSKASIRGTDAELKNEILKRFVLRPDMIASVDLLRSKGLIVAMLSDQTDWLDDIDRQATLFRHFNTVFNSFRLHKSKRDASVFGEVCTVLGVKTGETLFVDDNINHIKRAQGQGLQAIHFVGIDDYKKRMAKLL
jgi:putative hydrolase of the HAD superfamily